MKTLSENRRARFDYEILETFTGGVALLGFEVKSVRAGRAHLDGGFVVIRGGELYLTNVTIPPYQPKNTAEDYDPSRSRKLLVTKKELNVLLGTLHQKGLTLVPLRFIAPGHTVKLEFALARGKKTRDKRETIKKRETERAIRRAITKS